MPDRKTPFGVGIYSYAEAGALIAKSTQWVTQMVKMLRIVRNTKSELEPYGLGAYLSFLDVVELALLAEFRNQGIRMPEIRKAAKYLQHRFEKQPHPFALQELWSDPKTIFADFVESGSAVTEDISRKPGQIVWKTLSDVRHRAVMMLEFGEEGVPVRWWPEAHTISGRGSILIDPSVRGGEPVIASTRVSTWQVYEAWEAEHESPAKAAKLLEIDLSAAKAAIAFEKRLRAA